MEKEEEKEKTRQEEQLSRAWWSALGPSADSEVSEEAKAKTHRGEGKGQNERLRALAVPLCLFWPGRVHSSRSFRKPGCRCMGKALKFLEF